MGYDIGWIIPKLRNPGKLWTCASSVTVAVVGLFSKFIILWVNKATVYNRGALDRAMSRPAGTPLLTYSNHHSCFDDPGLWGVLKLDTLCRARRMRWSLAAHDICFTNALHAAFFALGKCVPCVRGAGVYQPAIDFCIERLHLGEWVHIFPEGRVNIDKEYIRLKWGVGRVIWELWAAGASPPLVLPLWHEGLERVLPNTPPYRLRATQRVHLTVGEPLDLRPLLQQLRVSGATDEACRLAITSRLQRELFALRDRAHTALRAACPAQAHSYLDNRTDIHYNPRGDAPLLTKNEHIQTNGKHEKKSSESTQKAA